ncbi:helicase associated domain-containing protein [Streptomyces sp. NPDC101115]|uniref:helicase associated domain-containing protein n=1 Tax=Streptomyces sp. NPDC101115 TaxID=3366106 RepID=UPI003815884E
MDEDRIAQPERLGRVWSHFDVAWEKGLAAARGWATEHGHLLAPLDATHHRYRVGIWLKNARAAARRAQGLQQRQSGPSVDSWSGALSPERREQLEGIDPSWCPVRPVAWQRAFHLPRLHLDEAGSELPTKPGVVVRQGEDLGRWVRSVRLGWDKRITDQQWMCRHILGITPADENEKPQPRRTQADPWAMNTPAAKQFYEREGHLRVPRKHVETVLSKDGGELQLRLSAWVSNQRSRAAPLSTERAEQLTSIGHAMGVAIVKTVSEAVGGVSRTGQAGQGGGHRSDGATERRSDGATERTR